MPTSGGMLQDIQTDLVQEAMANLGPEWENMPVAAKIDEARRRLGLMEQIQNTSNFAMEQHQEKIEDLEEMRGEIPVASTKFFDLKTAQLTDPNAGSLLPEQGLRFADACEVRDYLEAQNDIDSVIQEFMSLASDTRVVNEEGQAINPRQVINDEVKSYMEGKGSLPSQEKLRIAMSIYDALPQAAKSEENPEMSEKTQIPSLNQQVANSNKAIKKLAETIARQHKVKKTATSSFNMSKFAQHKGMENNIMFGPDQTRVDPFTGQLISNWHVYERNKGFGFKLDDALDIDYETIWRENVMDKYNRPYRNKDGEWVGGYIQRRFEVDKWIPPANNLQLKPGQKRRPILPEYGNTESRLQNMRASSGKDGRNRVWCNTEKPFDWNKDGTSSATFNLKKANSKKKVK